MLESHAQLEPANANLGLLAVQLHGFLLASHKREYKSDSIHFQIYPKSTRKSKGSVARKIHGVIEYLRSSVKLDCKYPFFCFSIFFVAGSLFFLRICVADLVDSVFLVHNACQTSCSLCLLLLLEILPRLRNCRIFQCSSACSP